MPNIWDRYIISFNSEGNAAMTSGQNEASEMAKGTSPSGPMATIERPFAEIKSVRQFLADSKAMIHNFTGNKMEVYKKIALASSPVVKRGADNREAVIEAKFFLAQYVEMTQDKTGDVVDSPRVVVFDKNGTCYGFVSWGVLDSVDQLVSAFGMYDWPDGIKLKIMEANTRRGNRMTALVPVE